MAASARSWPRERRTPVAAEPGHEPGLHRQGRLLHRHEAGAARGRGRRSPTRERLATLAACSARPVPARGARQGLAAAGLRRPPRRDHRHRGRPGLHRPARRLAGGATTWPAAPATPRRQRRAPHRHVRRGRSRWSSSTLACVRRTDLVRGGGRAAGGVRVVDDAGAAVPACVEAPGARALRGPGRAVDWAGGPTASWTRRHADGWTDLRPRRHDARTTHTGSPPTRPAAARVTSVRDRRARPRAAAPGRAGNELRVYEEYPAAPARSARGPWHLLPTGRLGPARRPAEAASPGREPPVGARLVARGVVDGDPSTSRS